MITLNKGYYIIYSFLEYYWQNVDKYSDYSVYPDGDSFTLVTIVSVMNPEDANEPTPIDQAKYEDWVYVMNKLFKDQDSFTEAEIFEGLLNYLIFYMNQFHFKVQNVIDDISKNFNIKYQKKWNMIIQSIEN